MNQVKNFLSQSWSGGVAIGLLGMFLVLATLDPTGSYPQLGEGPGITLDESFNVQQGILLVEALRAYGPFLFDPANTKDIFGGEQGIPYLPDHPPLGRWILGFAHHFTWLIMPPVSPEGPAVTAAARPGSALLYGLTLLLIGWTSAKWFGPAVGWASAISVLLMPRLFAHAHIASLETCVGLTYCAAVLVLAGSWSRYINVTASSEQPSPGNTKTFSWKSGLFPGFLLGLAMLTKIQGFLLIPCVILWALIFWRQSAIKPLLAWGGVAGVVFFLGWPWLWISPVEHLSQYLGSATDRASLNVFYWGQIYQDVSAPWHYPWVMFLVTIPAIFHPLGVFGATIALKNPATRPASLLVIFAICLPLILFSTTTAVYDGVRLFLMIFPLWGVFIGYGAILFWQFLKSRGVKQSPLLWTSASLLILIQSWGLISMHPCQLSYTNLPSNWKSSLEATYWGDSLTRAFWKACLPHLPQGAVIELAPVLHQFQCEEIVKQNPLIRHQRWQIVPYSEAIPDSVRQSTQTERYYVLFFRKADLPERFRTLSTTVDQKPSTPAQQQSAQSQPLTPLLTLERGGILLAALYREPSPSGNNSD